MVLVRQHPIRSLSVLNRFYGHVHVFVRREASISRAAIQNILKEGGREGGVPANIPLLLFSASIGSHSFRLDGPGKKSGSGRG